MAPQESIHPIGEATALSFGVGIIMEENENSVFQTFTDVPAGKALLSTGWQ